MARKKQLIIPVFIPFAGCPEVCVFCDQRGISGKEVLPELSTVIDAVERHLSTWKGSGRTEVAFYGGSFTGLPPLTQVRYLESVAPYLKSGRVNALRVSTRPDYISEGAVGLLKRHGVETIELGVQSMNDTVLKASGRGHRAEDAVKAVRIIKDGGLKVGLQFMPGLPGDTEETVLETARTVAALGPDFVRVYPTLVLRDTALHRMYLEGRYRPWAIEEMVRVLKKVLRVFKDSKIPVIRLGLQPTEELERSLVAGPYHPSLRQLVEAP